MPGIYGCSFNHKLIYWCILKKYFDKKYHEILVINIISLRKFNLAMCEPDEEEYC